MNESNNFLVFVYGTLRRGGSNAWRMQGSDYLGAAQVKGRLYAVSSWYPGLVPDVQGMAVRGDLFRVSVTKLAELHAFEGHEYELQRVIAIDFQLRPLEVQLWSYVATLDHAALISSGDWLAHLDGGEPCFT